MADSAKASVLLLGRREPPVRYSEKVDASSSWLLDHLIGPEQRGLRDRQAEALCGLEVDDQLVLRRLLDGKILRPGALEDLVEVAGSPSEEILGSLPRRTSGRRRQ
jgi:hypothetical protein